MRLFIRHAIALLLLLFICRLAVQAQAQDNNVSLPKAILLSRLSKNAPIPSRDFDQRALIKAIAAESERLVDRKKSPAYR